MIPSDIIIQKPDYLDHPSIRNLFFRVLDLLKTKNQSDRKNRMHIPYKKKYFKDLFDQKGTYDDIVFWGLLQKCNKDHLIFIKPPKDPHKDPSRPPWENCRFIFNTAYEEKIRYWLDYQIFTREDKEWQEAFDQHKHLFVFPEKLKNPIAGIRSLKKPANEIITRLALIPDVLKEKPMTAYQLSATLFWGYSKVFMNHEDWLKELFHLPEGLLIERPILIEVSLPSKSPEGILMIENLDCYFSACEGKLPDCESLIKVYTQGFRGTAQRTRNALHARFHFFEPEQGRLSDRKQFISFWLSSEAVSPYPVYFFGDLDWAGMDIFCSLKKVFPELMPWKTGYKKLITARERGLCHTPEMAAKEKQKNIDSTGDAWFDDYILKPMKENPLFVDQEIVC